MKGVIHQKRGSINAHGTSNKCMKMCSQSKTTLSLELHTDQSRLSWSGNK